MLSYLYSMCNTDDRHTLGNFACLILFHLEVVNFVRAVGDQIYERKKGLIIDKLVKLTYSINCHIKPDVAHAVLAVKTSVAVNRPAGSRLN